MTARTKVGRRRSNNPDGRLITSDTPLADELRRRGWISKDLATRIATPYRTIQRWVMGQNQTPAWVWQSLKNIDQIEKLRRRIDKQSRAPARARVMTG
jgi:hypothetical protein